jgi:hypothetical protein
MSRRLDAMRANSKGDWKFADIEALCLEFGASCRPPTGGGSHYRVYHAKIARKLTIPFKRPIKAVYIRQLVSFIDDVRKLT